MLVENRVIYFDRIRVDKVEGIVHDIYKYVLDLEDIQFLRDRIERIKKLQTPNSTVLKTYQAMLESRESVLDWLRENGDLDEGVSDAV